MKKATGIIRKIDELGRIVIPIEIRRTFGIYVKDAVEIFVDQEGIVLKKHAPCCIFCGSKEDTAIYRNKLICKNCLAELQQTN